MMKVLFVCDYYPPFTPGGAEWSSYYLAQAMAKQKGMKIIVLTPNFGKYSFRLKKDRVRIIRYPFYFKLKPGQAKLSYFLNNNFFYYLYSSFWLIKTCFQEKIDLIHLQSNFSLISAWLAKKVVKKPLVFTFRDTALFCPIGLCLQNKKINKNYSHFSHYWQKCRPEYLKKYLGVKNIFQFIYSQFSIFFMWLDNQWKKKTLKQIDKHLFISQALKDLYLKSGLSSKTKAEVVYNLPPLEVKLAGKSEIQRLRKKHKLENKKVVLFAGRLTLGKGFYDLVEAARVVTNKYQSVIFLFVGKGSPDITVDNNLRIASFVSHQELHKYYQLADVVVVPSKGLEPFGRIPQEASLFKKPVIATLSGGLKEQIVNDKTGFLVERGNSRQLARAILKLLENEKLAIEMGEENNLYVKSKFNQEKIVNKLTRVYKKAL